MHRVSPATVRRAQTEHAAQQAAGEEPIRQVGIDQFSLRKGRRYATGLHDLTRHRLFKVVARRTSAVLQAALERLPAPEAIEVVSMDMAGAFRAAVQGVLPRAAIVVDKFPVIAHVTATVKNVWRGLVRGTHRNDPVRQAVPLLLRGPEHLQSEEKASLRRWYQMTDPKAARLELRAWRGILQDRSDLADMQALEAVFGQWHEDILNYFSFRVAQAVVEGKNNRAKVSQRRAYGCRNFGNYRRQLLLAG